MDKQSGVSAARAAHPVRRSVSEEEVDMAGWFNVSTIDLLIMSISI